MASKDTASQTAEVSLNADQAELQKFAELAHKWWDVNQSTAFKLDQRFGRFKRQAGAGCWLRRRHLIRIHAF
jgi:hypothetical protein